MPDMHIHSNLACTVSAGGLHWQTGGAQQGDLHWRTGGRQVHPAAAVPQCVYAYVTCHHHGDCNTSALHWTGILVVPPYAILCL